MKISDKTVLWYLSVVTLVLLVCTFLKHYSENKVGEYKNEIIVLQNKLNAELGRVLYYMTTANQHETLSLLATINKNIEVSSFIVPNARPTGNAEIDLIEQKKNELKRQLKQKDISAATYFNERLKLDTASYEGHFNDFNRLNGELNNKLKQGSRWSFWNSFFTITEFVCILLNVLGQSYLIVTVYRKIKIRSHPQKDTKQKQQAHNNGIETDAE